MVSFYNEGLEYMVKRSNINLVVFLVIGTHASQKNKIQCDLINRCIDHNELERGNFETTSLGGKESKQ